MAILSVRARPLQVPSRLGRESVVCVPDVGASAIAVHGPPVPVRVVRVVVVKGERRREEDLLTSSEPVEGVVAVFLFDLRASPIDQVSVPVVAQGRSLTARVSCRQNAVRPVIQVPGEIPVRIEPSDHVPRGIIGDLRHEQQGRRNRRLAVIDVVAISRDMRVPVRDLEQVPCRVVSISRGVATRVHNPFYLAEGQINRVTSRRTIRISD